MTTTDTYDSNEGQEAASPLAAKPYECTYQHILLACELADLTVIGKPKNMGHHEWQMTVRTPRGDQQAMAKYWYDREAGDINIRLGTIAATSVQRDDPDVQAVYGDAKVITFDPDPLVVRVPQDPSEGNRRQMLQFAAMAAYHRANRRYLQHIVVGSTVLSLQSEAEYRSEEPDEHLLQSAHRLWAALNNLPKGSRDLDYLSTRIDLTRIQWVCNTLQDLAPKCGGSRFSRDPKAFETNHEPYFSSLQKTLREDLQVGFYGRSGEDDVVLDMDLDRLRTALKEDSRSTAAVDRVIHALTSAGNQKSSTSSDLGQSP